MRAIVLACPIEEARAFDCVTAGFQHCAGLKRALDLTMQFVAQIAARHWADSGVALGRVTYLELVHLDVELVA